jgi:hypothetical protein
MVAPLRADGKIFCSEMRQIDEDLPETPVLFLIHSSQPIMPVKAEIYIWPVGFQMNASIPPGKVQPSWLSERSNSIIFHHSSWQKKCTPYHESPEAAETELLKDIEIF